MGIKEWKFAELDKEKAMDMKNEWDIPFFLAVLLNVRKLNDKDSADKFLTGYGNFSSPFDLIDMDKLKERVESAIKNLEKICIYGDYDADGVTSVALFYLYLKKRGANVIYYIPKRETDGYGLNCENIDMLYKTGVRLIITVDNGISAYSEAEHIKSLGIDLIITDHHRPPEIIPNAVAVVNPYRKDCSSKFKSFSGVGVAFKAVVALETGKSSLEQLIQEYADLVTIGTIGDFIELKGETRDLVREGLKIIAKTERPGIRAILKSIGLYGKRIDTSNVVYGIVPRINVSGRMDDASSSVKLLIAETEEEAFDIFQSIDKKNYERKFTESEIYTSVENLLKEQPIKKHEKIIILSGEKWHQGVLGIVTSRIVKKYGKPCILITFDKNEAKGSCRSIEGFSIHEAIAACSEHLDRFGGHPMAAGINLKTENIENFKNAILKYVDSAKYLAFPSVNIDCRLNPALLSLNMVKQLDKLKPFGSANPEPIFALCNLKLKNIRPISNGKHLKLILSREQTNLEVLYFGKSIDTFLYNLGETVDVAVTMHKNDINWTNSISLYVTDVKLSSADLSKVLKQKRIYENFKTGKKLSISDLHLLLPSKDDFKVIYNYFMENKMPFQRVDVIVSRINEKVCASKIYIILDVFQELGIAKVDFIADEFYVEIEQDYESIDFNLSPTIQKIKSKTSILEGKD